MKIVEGKEINIIFDKDDTSDDFYKTIYKLKRISKHKSVTLDIDKNIKICEKDKKDIINVVQALNIKDKNQRLEFVYDKACEYIDDEFVEKNFCEFQDGKCIAQRQNKEKHKDRINGCCGHCMYISCKGCTIKSLACKIFFCPYIKKKKECLKMRDIKIIKYFFNWKQKIIARCSIYETKEESLKDLKRKSLILWSFTSIKKNQ